MGARRRFAEEWPVSSLLTFTDLAVAQGRPPAGAGIPSVGPSESACPPGTAQQRGTGRFLDLRGLGASRATRRIKDAAFRPGDVLRGGAVRKAGERRAT